MNRIKFSLMIVLLTLVSSASSAADEKRREPYYIVKNGLLQNTWALSGAHPGAGVDSKPSKESGVPSAITFDFGKGESLGVRPLMGPGFRGPLDAVNFTKIFGQNVPVTVWVNLDWEGEGDLFLGAGGTHTEPEKGLGEPEWTSLVARSWQPQKRSRNNWYRYDLGAEGLTKVFDPIDIIMRANHKGVVKMKLHNVLVQPSEYDCPESPLTVYFINQGKIGDRCRWELGDGTTLSGRDGALRSEGSYPALRATLKWRDPLNVKRDLKLSEDERAVLYVRFNRQPNRVVTLRALEDNGEEIGTLQLETGARVGKWHHMELAAGTENISRIELTIDRGNTKSLEVRINDLLIRQSEDPSP